MDSLIQKLLIAYFAWNVIVFFMYGIDKLKAKKDAWRISEKTLLVCAFLFGGVGAFAGMKVFHHKTRHKKFTILVPLFAIINIAALVYFFFLK